ncbi:MAG TPA: hypothetical protein VFN30_02370 [Chitinophagaceae bacterium]|nr:hypothetical protein [Chitinophagaceae bacterium]
MSKTSKILIGFLSFVPLILSGVIITQVFLIFPKIIQWEDYDPDLYTVFTTFTSVFVTGLIAGLLTLALLVFFIINMMNNRKIESGERLIWVIIFLLAGAIGYPIYWYLRIWKDEI